MLEKLKADLEKYKQMRDEALLQIRTPEAALINYHRLDALVTYIQELLKTAQEASE